MCGAGILAGHDRILAGIFPKNAGTNAVMAASKGRSTVGVTDEVIKNSGSRGLRF
jgi:hypothetical protein